jgi:hypothetical protein
LPGGPKPAVDIETALSWAFRDELPKGFRGRGSEAGYGGPRLQPSPLLRILTLGTPIDACAREPGFPLALGNPHPDALKIEAAVARLSGADLVYTPAGYGAELAGLVPEYDCYGEAALQRVAECVVIRAKLADRPHLGEAPTPSACTSPVNGKIAVRQLSPRPEAAPASTDLATKAIRKDVYARSAYCGLQWSPDPKEVLRDRAEYLVWWLALAWLTGELQDLESRIIAGPAAPRRPWPEPKRHRTPAVLPDLQEQTRQPAAATKGRKVRSQRI